MSVRELQELAGRREIEVHEVNARIVLAELLSRNTILALLREDRRRPATWRRKRRNPERPSSITSTVVIRVDDADGGDSLAVESSSSHSRFCSSHNSRRRDRQDGIRRKNRLESQLLEAQEKRCNNNFFEQTQEMVEALQQTREEALERELEEQYTRHKLRLGAGTPSPWSALKPSQGGGVHIESSTSPKRNGMASRVPLALVSRTPQPETAHSLAKRLMLQAPQLVLSGDVRGAVRKHITAVIEARNRKKTQDRMTELRLLNAVREQEGLALERTAALEARLAAARHSPSPVRADKSPGITGGTFLLAERTSGVIQNKVFDECVRRTVWCTNREVDRWHEVGLSADLTQIRKQQAVESAKACRYYQQRVQEATKSREMFLASSQSVCDDLARLYTGAAAKAFSKPLFKKKKMDSHVLLEVVKKLPHRTAVVSAMISSLEANDPCLDLRLVSDDGVTFDDLLAIRSVLNVSDCITGILLRYDQMRDLSCCKAVATLPKDFACVTKVSVDGFVDNNGDNNGEGFDEDGRCAGIPDGGNAATSFSPRDEFVQFAVSLARRNRQVRLFKHGLLVARRQRADQLEQEKLDVVNLADMRKRSMLGFQCFSLLIRSHETLLRELLILCEEEFRSGCALFLSCVTRKALAGGKLWQSHRHALLNAELRERRALETLAGRNMALIDAELSAGLAALRRKPHGARFHKTAVLATTFNRLPWIKRSPGVEPPSQTTTDGPQQHQLRSGCQEGVPIVTADRLAGVTLLSSFILPTAADIAVSSSGDIRSVHSSNGKRPSSRLGGTSAAAPVVHLQVEPMND
jgi:hypothetical protein